MSSKQALAVLLTIIIAITGYIAYTVINENKVRNENLYYVTFNSNGGSEVPSVLVKENEKVAKPDDPIQLGYTFKYWTLNNEEFDFNTKITDSITLVAEWEEE